MVCRIIRRFIVLGSNRHTIFNNSERARGITNSITKYSILNDLYNNAITIIKINKKIGNTNSVRVGALMFLIASALLTLGEKYIVIMLGQILYELAFTFRNMANAILKNNLELQNEASEYIKIKTRANTVYAVATMIVSLIVSTMFNMNNYLPMFGCMSVCFICFILAFGIVDYSNNKSITENRKKEKIQYGKIILLLIIVFIRDPFEVYMQDLALKNVGQDKQQTLLTIMELASKIGRAIIGVSFSIILLKEPMISIIIILFILSIAEILMSIKLYKMVNE